MRILITGASGLLGEAVVRRFEQSGDVTGWCFSQTSTPFTAVDLRDPPDVDSAFRTAAPNVVMNRRREEAMCCCPFCVGTS